MADIVPTLLQLMDGGQLADRQRVRDTGRTSLRAAPQSAFMAPGATLQRPTSAESRRGIAINVFGQQGEEDILPLLMRILGIGNQT